MTDTGATQRVTIRRPGPAGWFSLKLLFTTGVKALVSSLIGAQTGRREILAALDGSDSRGKPQALSETKSERGDGDIWIDYVADLGDGFNATHSIAWLIGRDFLFLKGPGVAVEQPRPAGPSEEAAADAVPGAAALPRADILIFGGDEVYPYASQADYRDRTVGPYYAARPWGSADPDARDGEGARSLYAIPGNHDWYDGLTAFIRVFCQPGRWIGAWAPQQKRSYFSLQLPHGFWIWGLDLATEDDIDPPQLAYFEAQAKKFKEDDQVIICTPKPAWAECSGDDEDQAVGDEQREPPEAWQKLRTITKFVEESKARVPLLIAGDLHHYAHHAVPGGGQSHYVTCGGGGAFMLGTTMQPKLLSFEDMPAARFVEAFPSMDDSKKMRRGAVMMFWHHRLFCAVLATVQLAIVWLFNSSSILLKALPPGDRHRVDRVFLDAMGEAVFSLRAIPSAFSDFFTILANRPGTLVVFLAVMAGFSGFGYASRKSGANGVVDAILGALHFLAQFLLAIILAVVARKALVCLGWDGALYAPLMALLTIGAGTMLHGLLFSGYLLGANAVAGTHEQEVYSSQAIQDWKCFLRMKLNSDGLTIYPVGLEKIETVWKPTLTAQAAVGQGTGALSRITNAVSRLLTPDSFDVPKGTTHLFNPENALKPCLIEKPIIIKSLRGGGTA